MYPPTVARITRTNGEFITCNSTLVPKILAQRRRSLVWSRYIRVQRLVEQSPQ